MTHEYYNTRKKVSYKKDEVWYIDEKGVLSIKQKAEDVGVPLKNWNIDIRCGFKTGLNDAFIVSDEKKAELCKSDPRSAELLRKNLRGKDVRKYSITWQNLWIIVAKFGFYKEADNYPAIFEHLSGFEDRLKNRGQCRYTRGNAGNEEYSGQHHWLELDNNPKEDIISAFEAEEKILYPDIAKSSPFYYDDEQYFSQETVFAITGEHLKYLTGLLNSKCVLFLYKSFYAGGGLGKSGIRFKKKFIETLPIPRPEQADETDIVNLVDVIRTTKDDGEMERCIKTIDQIVYKLYKLSEDEINIIEEEL